MGNSGERLEEDEHRELVLDGNEDSPGNGTKAFPEHVPRHQDFQHPKL